MRSTFAALTAAFRSALQWRICLLWLLALCLPSALFVFPAFSFLHSRFGHSLHAASIASGENLPLLLEGLSPLLEEPTALRDSLVFSSIVPALLLSPWLSGLLIASLRADKRLGLLDLVRGGITEYGRMSRMLLCSILPLSIALGIGKVAKRFAENHTQDAILESTVLTYNRIALGIATIALLLTHAGIETARAQFGADRKLRSALIALWRGNNLLFRQPLQVLTAYLTPTLLGYALTALLAVVRLQLTATSTLGFTLSAILSLAILTTLTLTRITRLYALTKLATAPRTG